MDSPEGLADQTNLPLRIRHAPGLVLSAAEVDLLARAFPGKHQVFVEREFRSGYSGAVVFLVSPHPGEAQIVVKIGPLAELRREYAAYHQFVKKTSPQNTARLQGEPIEANYERLALLCYTFAGGDPRLPTRSLQSYYDSHGGQATADVLDRVFRVYGRHWWAINQPQKFVLSEQYDRLLPVHLKLKPSEESDSTGKPLIAGRVGAGDLRDLAPGQPLHLQDFRITEIRVDRRELTLTTDPPPGEASALLRLRLETDDIVPLRPGTPLESLDVTVTTTRQALLVDLARSALVTFDPDEPEFTLAGRSFPNPLLHLADLLDQVVEGKFSTIHGDLNLQNILVDETTGFAWLIDFAETRRGPTLFDVQRLEAQVITKLLAGAIARAGLESTVVADLLESLHADPPLMTTPHLALQKPYTVLVALRRLARQYLMDDRDWAEYYSGLVIALVASLKYPDLMPAGRQAALIGAAIAYGLMGKPLGTTQRQTPAVRFETPVLTETTRQSQRLSRQPRWLALLGMGGWFKPEPKAPLALVINVAGRIEVRRKDSDRVIPAAFGMQLFYEDAVITYDASTSDVVCNNGYLYHLDWQSTLVVRCGEFDDQPSSGRLPHDLAQRVTRPSVALTILTKPEVAAAEQIIRNLPLDMSAESFLLSRLYQSTGLPEQATAELENLAFSEIQPGLAQALGNLYFELGLLDQAQTYYSTALNEAFFRDDPIDQAEARVGLGDIAKAQRDHDTAQTHWHTAERLYRQMGYLAKAEEIAALLPPATPEIELEDSNWFGRLSRWLRNFVTDEVALPMLVKERPSEGKSVVKHLWLALDLDGSVVALLFIIIPLVLIYIYLLFGQGQHAALIAVYPTSTEVPVAHVLISTSALTLTPTATPIPTITLSSTGIPTITPGSAAGILISSIPVYSGPGEAYAAVGNLPAGIAIEIRGVDRSESWLNISWPGGRGWVDMNYVGIEGAVNLPIILPSPPPAFTPTPTNTLTPIPPAATVTLTPTASGTPTAAANAPRTSITDTPGYQVLDHQVMGPRDPTSAAFAPHGGELAATEGTNLYTIGRDGGSGYIWVKENETIRPVEGIVWSPNGALIAFVADLKQGCAPPACRRVGLLIRADENREPFYLNPPEGYSIGLPRWTQDGRLLVNIYNSDPSYGTVYIYDTSGRRQVASGEYILSSSHEGQRWHPWLPGKIWRADQSRPTSYYD